MTEHPKGMPFTATVHTTFDETLADGNRLHGESRTVAARDAAGRTRTERAAGCSRGADGQLYQRFSITVNDRDAQTSTTWTEGEGALPEARVHHRRQQPSPQVERTPEQLAELRARSTQSQERMQRETRTEKLGTRTIGGVEAEGNRVTWTRPAGEDGNALPIETVRETWFAKQLGQIVMSVTDDPTRGKTMSEFEEVRVGDPDPALFAPPSGYTLHDETPLP